MDVKMFRILMSWVRDLVTMMVSWNRASFYLPDRGWGSHSSWLRWRRMEIFISSRCVPSNDVAQEKTLNADCSKGFLRVRLPVHNVSRILGVIWAHTPLSFCERSRTLRELSFFLDPNISSSRGVMLVAGVNPSVVLSRFMAFWVV